MTTPETMARRTVSRLQPYLANALDPSVDDRPLMAGILGAQPSLYAKSPLIWNAAFRELGIDAVYVPLDVSVEDLGGLVQALRECPAYVGGNVTVPHKMAVVQLLDEVDPFARQVGAVNTICRAQDGRLVGYNTDAEGAIGSLVGKLPEQEAPFLGELRDKRVLLIGAGGAGRAAAFALAQQLGSGGALYIANRSVERGRELAAEVRPTYSNAWAIAEEAVLQTAGQVDLLINASTRGQGGLRRLPGDRVTCLEPYSCLAPARPATLDAAGQYPTERELYHAWHTASLEDIQANQETAARAMLQCRPDAAFVDFIYYPLETVFLAQARLSGHRTLNGKSMNVIQAVAAFVRFVMKPYLEREGWGLERVYERVMRSMSRAW